MHDNVANQNKLIKILFTRPRSRKGAVTTVEICGSAQTALPLGSRLFPRLHGSALRGRQGLDRSHSTRDDRSETLQRSRSSFFLFLEGQTRRSLDLALVC